MASGRPDAAGAACSAAWRSPAAAPAGQGRQLLLGQASPDPKVVERVTELPARRAGRIDGAKLPTPRHPPVTSNAADRKHRYLLAARAEGVFLFRTNIAFAGPPYLTRVVFVSRTTHSSRSRLSARAPLQRRNRSSTAVTTRSGRSKGDPPCCVRVPPARGRSV